MAPDVEAVDAEIRFDVAARVATVDATVTFVIDGPGGCPALDLRQALDSVTLDGRTLDPGSFPHHDLGGGPGAAMRVLDVDLETGSRHRLRLAYQLDTPDARGAEPLGWEGGGVRFDLWMSDLFPGRYLEMWLPAPLCGDRFALSLDVSVTGTDREHVLVTNAGPPPSMGKAWARRYPAAGTSLSPMLVLAPADSVEWRARSMDLPGRAEAIEVVTARHVEVDADLEACEADVTAWLTLLAARYGPWSHGPAMTAFVWGPGRGMEYDGATTASVGALEHEVFHSWFGRGVKPATASDGWIDEAFTSWATASRRVEEPRYAAEDLGLDEDPVVLYPAHPWSRHTPVESYASGSRLFAGVAFRLGGADRLRSAMAAWYAANAGGLVTTAGLLAHLQGWSGADLVPLWDRYVHGRS